MKKWRLTAFTFVVILLFSGCNMRTVDELYCLPKRSQLYMNLQSEIDKVMSGAEYNAPLSGENRQAVQMADLDGDGKVEYLLFAKNSSDRPLQIYIFSGDGDSYYLADVIESTGTAFEQVEYVQMDGRKGLEIVVGRQVSDRVVRSVSVYSMVHGEIEQMMSANYSKIVCSDLNSDGRTELLVLRPGSVETDNGVAELYSMSGGAMERSAEVNMSEPADKIKRIMVSKLNDGTPAVYVASDVTGSAIITDVYAMVNGKFTNVSFSSESGTSVQTLRNYYVYADDIDNDGVLELPSLITMTMPPDSLANQSQYIIRWYALTPRGSEIDKMHTYHNFVGGWYMKLETGLAPRMMILQQGNSYEFSIWDESHTATEKLFTIYVLTGQKREEQAQVNNRFALYRTESTVYAADMEVVSATYGITKESLINSFRLILQDWKTGET